MDLNRIKKAKEVIKKYQDYDEIAHSLEYDLFLEFIEWISKTDDVNPQINQLAREVLKPKEIGFSR